MLARKKKHVPVDYWKHHQNRRKLTNYLRTGNFKKIAGSPIYAMDIQRRRSILVLTAGLFLATGLYFVFF